MNLHNRLAILLLFILICYAGVLAGQVSISLNNPSFEDTPQPGKTPVGWVSCGQGQTTPPDVLGSPDRLDIVSYGVSQYPADGNTYLGMVVRDNNTWESISQALTAPLQGGVCYALQIKLSVPDRYLSVSPLTKQPVDFAKPAKLVLYGGYKHCEKSQLLTQTVAIEHLEWKDYTLYFQPEKSFTHFTIECYFATKDGVAYNGAILLDNASKIYEVNCREAEGLINANTNPDPAADNQKVKMPQSIIDPNIRIEKEDDLFAILKDDAKKLTFRSDHRPTEVAKAAFINLTKAKLNFGKYRLHVVIKNEEVLTAAQRASNLRLLLDAIDYPAAACHIHYRSSDKLPDIQWISELPEIKIGVENRLAR